MSNPFFEPSTLPYALPPFGEMLDEHFRPAFERGIAEHEAEIAAIIAVPDAATFENTIIPLERAGQVLARVSTVFYNRASADSSPFTEALEEELAPVLAAHSDRIRLDPALFARVRAVWAGVAAATAAGESVLDAGAPVLDAEARYLVERYHADFVRVGPGSTRPTRSPSALSTRRSPP